MLDLQFTTCDRREHFLGMLGDAVDNAKLAGLPVSVRLDAGGTIVGFAVEWTAGAKTGSPLSRLADRPAMAS
jgi:hypothetical protein